MFKALRHFCRVLTAGTGVLCVDRLEVRDCGRKHWRLSYQTRQVLVSVTCQAVFPVPESALTRTQTFLPLWGLRLSEWGSDLSADSSFHSEKYKRNEVCIEKE